MGQRFEGRNLDDALGVAASALGVERFQLEYHVVVEKRGFLGGTKRVVIEASVDEGRQPVSNESRDAGMLARSGFDAQSGESAPAAPASPARSRRDGGGRGRDGEGRGRGRSERGGRGGRDRDRDRAPREKRPRSVSSEPAPEQGEQSGRAQKVAEWCSRLVELAGFDLEVRTFEEEENRLTVRFYGGDVDLLTERGGSLLDSIQVLATKSFSEKEGGLEIECDASGFKEQRADDLERRAREFADEVRENGGERVFPPMSPVERRLVHVALAEDPDVETSSRGEGFLKRVVVRPRRSGEDVGDAG